MTKSHLPEEKLLRLIREKSAAKKTAAAGKTPSQPAHLDERLFFKFLNGALSVVFVGLAVFFVYRVFFQPDPERKISPQASETAKEHVAAEPTVAAKEVLPLAHYESQLAQRDLFERPLDQVAANASVDLTKRYKLVGIVLGDVPEAIVEDLTNKTTMFVHSGDQLESVQVKLIEEGRVVFLQEGLEVELKP